MYCSCTRSSENSLGWISTHCNDGSSWHSSTLTGSVYSSRFTQQISVTIYFSSSCLLISTLIIASGSTSPNILISYTRHSITAVVVTLHSISYLADLWTKRNNTRRTSASIKKPSFLQYHQYAWARVATERHRTHVEEGWANNGRRQFKILKFFVIYLLWHERSGQEPDPHDAFVRVCMHPHLQIPSSTQRLPVPEVSFMILDKIEDVVKAWIANKTSSRWTEGLTIDGSRIESRTWFFRDKNWYRVQLGSRHTFHGANRSPTTLPFQPILFYSRLHDLLSVN